MNKSELALHHQKRKKVAEVKEHLTALIDATNTMGFDDEVAQGILEALHSNHPTLIQSFMGSFKSACEKAAEGPRFKDCGDHRLQATSKFISEIAKMDIHFPYV